MLLTQDLDRLVIFNAIKGFEVIEENETTAIVKAGGGENWHEFVMKCLGKNLGGVENLSLIPGTVRAAPIQNIGAYGVELQDVFERLEATELATGKQYVFASCLIEYILLARR
ncbi:MAG: FAD-binding protein [Bacteroidota bacterium]